MKKKIISMVLLLLFVTLIPIGAFAHGGKTDAAGGHKDNQNASGLGPYHYHHGYGPHLHPNGVCPYSKNNNTQTTYITAPAVSAQNSVKIHQNSTKTKKTVIASGNVKINGNTVDNASLKYPLILYNNITYFPLTYRNKLSLGLTHESKYGDIYIDTGNASTYTADIEGTSTIGKAVNATIEDCYLYVDGKLYLYDSAWPLLRYNDIIYIPMTYDFANTLNLKISWSQDEGLSVSAKVQPVKQNEPVKTSSSINTSSPTQIQQKPKAVPPTYIQEINLDARPVLDKNCVYFVFSTENPTKYLGTISSDFNADSSIFNMTGTYGNNNAETSLWNVYSRYNDFDSPYSIYNMNATNPPFIADSNGYVYGFITMNPQLDTPAVPAYTLTELMNIFM